ncbi:hypothetical protein BDZ94DRAFT_1299911 [Collybia nuda]|uniref:Uncharacterized protein n=1 Tax=Collybia nuda TaxID=64659 RepID=A0A9P5Y120_9AGAR|nr:hypothetical protein BDZ94DRAFT_1299911 [Collybia nuda]
MSCQALSRASSAARAGMAPRSFHTSSSASASVVASPAVPHHTPILDIFDAPVTLGSSRPVLERRTSNPRPLAPTPRVPPRPLPPPIIFDGPAQPRNLPQQLQAQQRSPRPRTQKSHSTPPPITPMGNAEPLIQMFDGPARITRCTPRPAKGTSSLKYLVLIGAAGAVGAATQLT